MTVRTLHDDASPPPVPALALQAATRLPAELGAFDEPADLLSGLRAAASDRPAVARATAPGLLALHAVDAWQPQLESLGIPTTAVTHAFETSRREIWLWVNGDRRWGQLATYLAARVLRRADVRVPS